MENENRARYPVGNGYYPFRPQIAETFKIYGKPKPTRNRVGATLRCGGVQISDLANDTHATALEIFDFASATAGRPQKITETQIG